MWLRGGGIPISMPSTTKSEYKSFNGGSGETWWSLFISDRRHSLDGYADRVRNLSWYNWLKVWEVTPSFAKTKSIIVILLHSLVWTMCMIKHWRDNDELNVETNCRIWVGNNISLIEISSTIYLDFWTLNIVFMFLPKNLIISISFFLFVDARKKGKVKSFFATEKILQVPFFLTELKENRLGKNREKGEN